MIKNTLLDELFIVDAGRTAIGGKHKSLKEVSAAQLAGCVMEGLLRRTNLLNDKHAASKGPVDRVILGNTVSAGTGQNLARQAVFLSGLPMTVPAFTVNSVCASGLQAVISGIQSIVTEESGVILAGGTESASQCPSFSRKGTKDEKEGDAQDLIDSLIYDGLECQMSGKHMGELAEYIAEEFKITRQMQDQYALGSHVKACRAQEENKFEGEIITVKTSDNKFFSKDEKPRKNASLEKLMNLPPAFKEGGTVTAGNASMPADGAAVFLLASADAVREYHLTPRARILGYASVAVDPQLTFTAAVPATTECLRHSGLTLKEIDLFEICESFSAQAILTQRKLDIPEEKMNIFGGDVALGHPLGASGARALTTLFYALKSQNKKRGLVSVCFGSGGAVSVAIERIG
ncbi:MAG TPA: thiolase family protein [Candidatus Omnitrophota bacterium]|nr:thiolase family protein [Candidatus Omnitrophota bacterium]HPD84545.1 thiolase family protein [Candidatus Omnitrophota bacterium]HRZ03403.1 thiolase family protein [Candidatus Omnitrophota bacterium]